MINFRKLAHLQEQIGEERLSALVSSDNTGKVKDFCDTLITKNLNIFSVDDLPIFMKIGDRTYRILDLLKDNEKGIIGSEVAKRAKEMKANLGKKDGQYLLDHQRDIPEIFRDKVYFVFTKWCHPEFSGPIYCVYWCEDGWGKRRYYLNDDYWNKGVRVLLRVK